MNAERLLGRLEGVRSTGPGRWIARCPAHDDRRPSLNVREADDGMILVHCFAGCGAAAVLEAVGLELSALFPDRPTDHRRKPSRAWLDARDALACLAVEGQVLAVAASDIAEGRSVSSEDASRITTAASRLGNAWGMIRGHR